MNIGTQKKPNQNNKPKKCNNCYDTEQLVLVIKCEHSLCGPCFGKKLSCLICDESASEKAATPSYNNMYELCDDVIELCKQTKPT